MVRLKTGKAVRSEKKESHHGIGAVVVKGIMEDRGPGPLCPSDLANSD